MLCRDRAVSVNDLVNNTRQALNVSEEAIEKARTALKEAHDNLNISKNATTEVHLDTGSAFVSPHVVFISFPCPVAQVERRLQQLEDKQMDVMMRLNNLSSGVEALRNKTEMNRQMAKDALAQANNATQQASSLDKVSEATTASRK